MLYIIIIIRTVVFKGEQHMHDAYTVARVDNCLVKPYIKGTKCAVLLCNNYLRCVITIER